MLMIRDVSDLITYLETRKDMAKAQRVNFDSSVQSSHVNGMVYAYDQALEAIRAIVQTQKASGEIETECKESF